MATKVRRFVTARGEAGGVSARGEVPETIYESLINVEVVVQRMLI